MKKEIKSFTESTDADMMAALAIIKRIKEAEPPIGQGETSGGKIFQKELDQYIYVLDHFDEFENDMPRGFDPEKARALYHAYKAELAYLDILSPVTTHYTNSTMIKSVELKAMFSVMYDAVKKTAKKNSSIGYILEKLKALYARTTGDKNTKGDTPPEKNT